MADHVCPWWMGYVLLMPFRRLGQSPKRILGPHVRPGMTGLDIGCAMGWFSLPMARMVGPTGRVVCVDLEPRMLRSLERRARRARLAPRLEARRCGPESLGIEDLVDSVDFALAFAVVHEVPRPEDLMAEVAASLCRGGRLLLAEPRGHVTATAFATSLDHATAAGLEVMDTPRIATSHAALLHRP